MLDYTSLAAVVAVVREGSFERAARALNVTPSAVSQRVKQLEERLGSVLIIRGQPCKATDTGRLLCTHVEKVGLLEQELRIALPKLTRQGADQDRVTLRVAVNADSLGTWFPGAIAHFTSREQALLDVAVDDQEHTVEWLRSGEVLAAVTAHAQPVQGCNSLSLGRLNYVAVASPEFVRRYFSEGINAANLAKAPSLRFNRKDRLQAQWVRRVCRRDVDLPIHWLPSTHAFVDASVAGVGWGMNPVPLVREYLKSGALVELVPARSFAVPLYWQHTRLQVPMLSRLTQAVAQAARNGLGSAPMAS
jgi:LysR family transcriptional regulator, chromosome initiation inhibitor